MTDFKIKDPDPNRKEDRPHYEIVMQNIEREFSRLFRKGLFNPADFAKTREDIKTAFENAHSEKIREL